MIAGVWNRWQESPVVAAVVIAVVGLLVVQGLSVLAQRRLRDRGWAHSALVVRKLVTYVGVVVVAVAVARRLGVDLSALVATAGVATVAVGFAAQTSLSNLIAGVFLLVDRPFQVGDLVGLEGRIGNVQEITLMSTLVRTLDGVLVRWPNEVVLKSTILNYSRYPVRRFELPVPLRLGSDVRAARAAILTALESAPGVLIEPEPEVLALGLADGVVRLEVRVWLPHEAFMVGRTAVVEAVHEALGSAGVGIAPPQIEVARAVTAQVADG